MKVLDRQRILTLLSGITLNILLLFPGNVKAQTLSEYQDIMVQESRDYLINNQMPLPYLQSGFFYFSRTQDKAFEQALSEKWNIYISNPSYVIPKSKKYDAAPVFNSEETAYHQPHLLSYYEVQNNLQVLSKQTILPRIRKPETSGTNPTKNNFKFFGNNIAITYDPLLALPVHSVPGEEMIADYWKKIQVSNSHQLVNQLLVYKDLLGLNDWGYFLLAKACAATIFPGDEPNSTLLGWAILVKSGYDVKVGFNRMGLSLLFPTTTRVYGKPFITLNQADYYIDSPIFSFPVSVYSGNHASAKRFLDLYLRQSLNFTGLPLTKKIEIEWVREKYNFTVKYNPEVIRFYQEYPSTESQIYFEAPFTLGAKESLLKNFSPVLNGMKQVEAAAFLQKIVQKSFGYKPFNDLFGYDRFMFPEELLFSDESNDKGKSLLYAWLITNLLHESTCLVEYPGLFSVAMALKQPMDGDNFLLNGKTYTFTDPTFENAPMGMVMSEFYSQKPYLHSFPNNQENKNRKNRVWEVALGLGAERSGSSGDYLEDNQGNSYITGFFKEKSAGSGTEIRSPFIACLDDNNSLVWMQKFHSDKCAYGIDLFLLNENEIYLSGTFKGNLSIDGQTIQSIKSRPDLFIAQFNKSGQLSWLKKTGTDQLEEDCKLFYLITFNRSGENLSVQLMNEDERIGQAGFQNSVKDIITYVASRFQTTGLERQDESEPLKLKLSLQQHLSNARNNGCEKSISELSAILNYLLLNNTNISYPGIEAVLKNSSQPNKQTAFQKIKLLRNDDGIISLSTTDNLPLNFKNFKIENKAKMKIIPMDNMDLKISVIKGIEFEDGILKGDVNTLLLDVSTGHLLVDFGSDHLLVTKNIKND